MISPEEVLEGVQKARSSGGHITLKPYSPHTAGSGEINEYCIFLKPEVTEKKESLAKVWELLNNKFSQFDQVPTAAFAIAGAYLDRHSIMEAHYGVINAVSRRGAAAFPPQATDKLKALSEASGQQQPRILGGHQFIDAYPFFTSGALAVLFDNLPSEKLGGGTYAVRLTVEGEKVLLANGFHPAQLDHYTNPDAVILVLAAESAVSWQKIRSDFTGATDPARATEGSLRNILLREQSRLGLGKINIGRNGVHVSAGPVEALLELCRFIPNLDTQSSLQFTDTNFGRLLSERLHWSGEQIAALGSNPVVGYEEANASVFDLTETVDSGKALQVLSDIRLAPAI